MNFFQENFTKKAKTSIKTTGTTLTTSKNIENFQETCENIETFLLFYHKFIQNDSKFPEGFLHLITKIVEDQAETCSNNFYLKEVSLKAVGLLEKVLEKVGIDAKNQLSFIIFNCKEVCITKNKHQIIHELRKTLNHSNSVVLIEGLMKISENTKNYVFILENLLKSPGNSENQKFVNVSTVREGVALFQALRGVFSTNSLMDIVLFCNDSEYFISKIQEFSIYQPNFSENLAFLLDFSDIIPLIESELNTNYEKITENYKLIIKEKSHQFDFKEFEKNFLRQEAVLLSILKIIKNCEFRGVLPDKKSYVLLGNIIDELIFQTISKVLSLEDIFINETYLLKNFFDKIFDLKEYFDGHSPVEYSKEWERLEGLLEIIEGKLIDIVKMYERKRFEGIFNARQLRSLILALFINSEKRKNALKIIV